MLVLKLSPLIIFNSIYAILLNILLAESMHFDFHMWLVMSTIWSSTLWFKIVGSFEFSLLLQFAFDIKVATLNTCKFHLRISAEYFAVQTHALWYVVMSTMWSSILGFNISGSLNLISFWIWLHLKFSVWEIFSENFILSVLHVFFYLHYHKMWASHFFSCLGTIKPQTCDISFFLLVVLVDEDYSQGLTLPFLY